MGAIIKAVGTYFPERVLNNFDLERILALSGQETSDKWIVERTGIKKRRIAGEDENVATMAFRASRDALLGLNEDIPPIEHILLATNTSDRPFPSDFGFIQDNLIKEFPGRILDTASGGSGYFGCAGINIALSYADSFVKSGLFRTVLVIGSEKMSAVTDYSDRATCILLGDGASSYLISGKSEKAGFRGHDSRGDGSKAELIICDTGEKVDFYEAVRALEEEKAPVRTIGRRFVMDGKAVFAYVCREWENLIDNFEHNSKLNPDGIRFEDIGTISPHLFNLRGFIHLDEKYPGLLRKCGLDGDNGDFFCNTSTASQGRRVKQYHLNALSGESILMFGHGAGNNSAVNLYVKP